MPLPLISVANDSTQLRQAIEAYAGHVLPSWETVAATLKEVRLRTGEVLIENGPPHPYAYLLVQGMVKLHDVVDGKQRILAFREESNFVASISALRPSGILRIYQLGLDEAPADLEEAIQGVSRSTATAIEPCVLLRFDFRVVEQLAQRYIEWAQLLITYFYAHVLHVQADAYLTRSHTAEQRYRLLLERHPRWIARIKQRDLAAYLGITEVGLSRIATRVLRERTGTPALHAVQGARRA